MRPKNGLPQDQIRRHRQSSRRIEEAQRRASSDSSGILTQQVGEGYLRLRLSDGCSMTVFLLDPGVNDLAHIVAEFNSAFEMICRWHGRRFLLMTSREIRLAELENRLPSEDESDWRIAIARSAPGDTAEGLLARLDRQIDDPSLR